MAKQKKIPTAPGRATDDSSPQMPQQPMFNWRNLGIIGAAFAVLWLIAVGLVPMVGYWAVGGMAVITIAAAGFGIYLWRLISKQKAIGEILAGASTQEGRAAALAKLEAGDAKDAMNALAKAQLQAQEDPEVAIKTLEGVDIEKAPAAVQDQVRTMLALMYLSVGRTKEAGPVASAIRLDNAPDPKSKALSAAVMAESLARNGNPVEARKLVDTYSADDAAFAEVRPMLLRAQVFTFFGEKKRNLARKAMDSLIALDPNMIGTFAHPKMNPELQKMAREALGDAGFQTRARMKVSAR